MLVASHVEALPTAPFAESEASNPAKRRARQAAFEWLQNQCFNFANIKDPVPRLPFDAGKILQKTIVTWLKLPESLELLQEYDHKCSHVMLPTDDSRFQPLNPYEAVRKMQEESPSIPWFEPEKEHKIDKYMNLMLGLLKQALAAGSHRPLRVAGLRLEVQDGSLEERWTEVSSDLQNLSGLTDMEEIERRLCLQPFQRIFSSMRTTFDGLQKLTAEAVPELLRTGDQLQKSEQELRSKLKIISNTLKTAENYVSQDDPQWDQAIETLRALPALPTQIQEAQEIMERYKEEGRRAPSQVSTLQSVCLKIGEDLTFLRSAAYARWKFSKNFHCA